MSIFWWMVIGLSVLALGLVFTLWVSYTRSMREARQRDVFYSTDWPDRKD